MALSAGCWPFAAGHHRPLSGSLVIMEQFEIFTLRNRALLTWLACIMLGGGAAAALAPPALWMCAIGAFLLVSSILGQCARTGQWYTWQRWELRLSWFEGWAASTGIVLVVVPLLVIVLRSYAG